MKDFLIQKLTWGIWKAEFVRGSELQVHIHPDINVDSEQKVSCKCQFFY